MQEKTLLRIALITGLVGICLLFIISNEMDKAGSESSYMDSMMGQDSSEYLLLNGIVTKMIRTNKTTMLEIEQRDKISVVVIGQDYLDLKKGDSVEVKGSKEDGKYDGLSIIADEVRKT